jgi:hypothetical protein
MRYTRIVNGYRGCTCTLVFTDIEFNPMKSINCQARSCALFKEDFVLLTNNAGHFRRLYAAKDLHPGLVILVPNVPQEKQVLLFRAALRRLAELGKPVNKLLQVDIVGDEITLTLYDLPAGKLPPAP